MSPLEADQAQDSLKHADKSLNNRRSGIALATKKIIRKEDLDESQSSKGHMAANSCKKSASNHWGLVAHHGELAANHENNGDYDKARLHDRAAELHAKAADWHESAHRAYRRGDEEHAEYVQEKAKRAATDAAEHETRHGIKP
jgi:hypothetical protein